MQLKRLDPKTLAIIALSVLVLTEAFFLFIYKPKKTVVIEKKEEKRVAVKAKETVKKPTAGRIAIIVDDCGYNLLPCSFSTAIKDPVTFSILPDLQHSTDVAACTHQSNKEVMLHLPMEPHNNADKYPEGYIIKTSMSKAKIEQIINKALKDVPYVAGVNNHMGSKATESKPVMTIVFSVLKNKGFFFVDSLVTDHSVCPALAKTMQLPFAQRNIFLDNKNERAAIEKQFALLAEDAKKNGYAVAIGHARRLTLQIIKEQTERMGKEGFQFVTVKDLIEQK